MISGSPRIWKNWAEYSESEIVSPKLRVHEIFFHMRNVRTRMPFRYGVATLTSVPILHVTLNAEIDGGVRCTGYAADILPPKWFDKDPAKDYQDNVEDLLLSLDRLPILSATSVPAQPAFSACGRMFTKRHCGQVMDVISTI